MCLHVQVQECCISTTNVVGWSGGGARVWIPCGELQLSFQTPIGQGLKEIGPASLQRWSSSWLGHQTRSIPTLHIGRPALTLRVLLAWTWGMGPLSCRRFRGRKAQWTNNYEVLLGPNWLYSHQRWALRRCCYHLPNAVERKTRKKLVNYYSYNLHSLIIHLCKRKKKALFYLFFNRNLVLDESTQV